MCVGGGGGPHLCSTHSGLCVHCSGGTAVALSKTLSLTAYNLHTVCVGGGCRGMAWGRGVTVVTN